VAWTYFTIIQGQRVTKGTAIQVRFNEESGWHDRLFDRCKREMVNGKRQRAVYVRMDFTGTSYQTFTGPYTIENVRIADELTMIAKNV
jgi:hypothetical protein